MTIYNKETYKLIMKILDSDIRVDAKTEIIKFFTLPRNTPVRPMIELPDEEQRKELGPIKRPDLHDLERKENPQLAQEEDEMKKTLDGVVNKKK